MRHLRLSLLAVSLLAALIFLQYRLWFQEGGIRDMLQLKKALALQAVENTKLKKRNEELLFQIHRLQHSGDAVESRARNELGMIKKDETFYQVIK
jgi:cell division protein FtsB